MMRFPTYIWDKILWGRIKNEQNFCIRGGEANIFKDFSYFEIWFIYKII